MRVILLSAIAILVLVIMAIIVFTAFANRKERKTDYYAFFLLGLMWIAMGLIPGNRIFLAIGAAFLLIGLYHKKEWKKNRARWSNFCKKEQKIRKIVFIVLAFWIVVTFMLFLVHQGLL